MPLVSIFSTTPFLIIQSPALAVPTQRLVRLSSNRKTMPLSGQAGRVVDVERREGIAVETHQAVERAEPEIAVARLRDGDDGTLRQAVVGAPGVHGERRFRRRALSQSQRGARPRTKNWIRRFKLGGRIRGWHRRKKIFQKPLAGGMEWATFLLPIENGRSVFPVERRFDGSATEINCVHAGPFSIPPRCLIAIIKCRD